MAKYNFSATRRNGLNYQETLQVVNCDSFDEARRIVEKALHERELQETEEIAKLSAKKSGSTPAAAPENTPSGNVS